MVTQKSIFNKQLEYYKEKDNNNNKNQADMVKNQANMVKALTMLTKVMIMVYAEASNI
jgi:hypothetical protein